VGSRLFHRASVGSSSRQSAVDGQSVYRYAEARRGGSRTAPTATVGRRRL